MQLWSVSSAASKIGDDRDRISTLNQLDRTMMLMIIKEVCMSAAVRELKTMIHLPV